ncbi:DUF4328 domain-containing protein [Yinghuangia sp. ASG 101]|uniref:DUF4328 domain-containing protein n=1 Tax=Yinghuangia sp. ASG 101 TaxID=2896848 RepID=UPI001E5A7C9D|nr:DUF4328 domain-containing protein [Yinghuangia sp. ASG 101]UGQ12862.1 DUF4328 domain-containing protein [Yinghuangia sp. ASG 101]
MGVPPGMPLGGPGGHQPGHAWPPPMPMEWIPVKPLRGLANAVCILLGIVAGISVLGAIAMFHRAALVDGVTLSDVLSGDLEDADDFVEVTTALYALGMLAAGIVFVVWFSRARSNTEAWYGPSATMSKGWAIGGWFIPLANFVIPKIVAHDIWKRSDPQSAMPGGRPAGKALLWWWWIIYSVGSLTFLGSAAERKTEDELDNGDVTLSEYVDSVVAGDRVGAVALLLLVAGAVLAILVVQRVTAMQEQRMGLQPPPGAYAGAMPMAGAPGMPGMPGGGFGAPGMPGAPGAPFGSLAGPPPGWGGAAPQPPAAPAAPSAPVDLGKSDDPGAPR